MGKMVQNHKKWIGDKDMGPHVHFFALQFHYAPSLVASVVIFCFLIISLLWHRSGELHSGEL